MLQETTSHIVIYYLAGTMFILLLVTTIVIYIFLHQKKVNYFRFKMQVEETKKKEAVFFALQKGEEKERNRIAEELHDGVSAKLSGLNMYLDHVMSEINPYNHLISEAHQGINEVINELREISHNIYPEFLTENNLHTSIMKYIDQLNSKKGCHYRLFCTPDNVNINNNLKLQCYRIITELLYNIHKHAQAISASVQINFTSKHIQIIVEDDGNGFTKETYESTSGIGLKNIANRVNMLNGNLNIDSSAHGTTIIIEIPLNELT